MALPTEGVGDGGSPMGRGRAESFRDPVRRKFVFERAVYDAWGTAAARAGMSMAQYLRGALAEQMRRDGERRGGAAA